MAALSPAVAHHRARIAALTRAIRAGERSADDADLADAKRELAEAKWLDHIERQIAAAPPLSDEQRIRLAELLRPVGPPTSADRKAVVAERIAELETGGAA